jgi:hypothetical protein
MEYWKNGMMGHPRNGELVDPEIYVLTFLPIIPMFHYSFSLPSLLCGFICSSVFPVGHPGYFMVGEVRFNSSANLLF